MIISNRVKIDKIFIKIQLQKMIKMKMIKTNIGIITIEKINYKNKFMIINLLMSVPIIINYNNMMILILSFNNKR
jgi:hypothetical protein